MPRLPEHYLASLCLVPLDTGNAARTVDPGRHSAFQPTMWVGAEDSGPHVGPRHTHRFGFAGCLANLRSNVSAAEPSIIAAQKIDPTHSTNHPGGNGWRLAHLRRRLSLNPRGAARIGHLVGDERVEPTARAAARPFAKGPSHAMIVCPARRLTSCGVALRHIDEAVNGARQTNAAQHLAELDAGRQTGCGRSACRRRHGLRLTRLSCGHRR